MDTARLPYAVQAPSSVAWWFTMALFAERGHNLPMRDLALQRADEISRQRRLSKRKCKLGLPDWGTYDGENATHEFVVDRLGRRWQREIDNIYHPWFTVVEPDHA
jgi:hypothetical protein